MQFLKEHFLGLPYNYWTKYKDEESKVLNEMYVERKYDDFKDEMHQYQFEMNIKTYNEVMVKVNEYIKTHRVKSTTCPVNWYESGSTDYPFGIAEGSPISPHHLISIILYTDYTHLSSNFSSTFRKHGVFDSVFMAKTRNKKYWWWSKYLAETVSVYGDAYYLSLIHI